MEYWLESIITLFPIKLFVFLSATIVTGYIHYYWTNRRLLQFAKNFKGPKPLPIVGNALMLNGDTRDLYLAFLRMFTEWKPPARFWLGNRLAITIANPKDIEVIFSKCITKDYDTFRVAKPYLGEGLFSTIEGNKWKNNRRTIIPTFSKKILDSYLVVFNENSDILNGKLLNEVGKAEFDVSEYVGACTLDMICETAMGISVNAQRGDTTYIKYSQKCFEIMFLRMFNLFYGIDFLYKLTPLARMEQNYINFLHNFTNEVINKKKEKLEEKDYVFEEDVKQRKAFLDHLLESSNFNDRQLRDEVSTMIVAGNDTTSGLICFALVMLGLHSDLQDKVYEEIHEIFHDSDRPVDSTDLSNLKYLTMFIKETLRMYPIGPIILKIASEDLKLESMTVPKGTLLIANLCYMHYDPNIWPQPHKFDPSRFEPEEITKRHPCSWIPFGTGPRNCIGGKYAMMASQTILANILREYKIYVDSYNIEDIKLRIDLTLKMDNGFKIRLDKRN